MRCFFIVSCARSGSTSLATILDKSVNVRCAVEPVPNLNRETRDMMEGRISDAYALIHKAVVPRVLLHLDPYAPETSEIYGEKSLNYAPFIPHLYEILEPKFIFIIRDGRDVVKSLLDWHDNAFGNIYRECKDPGNLSPRALRAVANLPIHKDTSDYSRPRPLPGDPLYDEWENLTRMEMCAYYWSRINDLYLESFSRIPQSSMMVIDYTNPTSDDIINVLDFIGAGDTSDTFSIGIEILLSKRINSLQDRFAQSNTHPGWEDWDDERKLRFWKIAGKTMGTLGYTSGGKI